MTEPQQGRFSSRERSMLILLGAVAGLAVLAFIVLNVFGGADDDELGGPVGPGPGPIVEPTPTPTGTLPPETFEFFEGRDPFQPLVVAPPGGGGGGTDGGTDGGGTDGGGTDGGTDGGGTDGGGTDGGGGGEDGQQVEGRTVTLLDIFVDGEGELTALVEVDGEQFRVHEGDTFADNFRLNSLSERCGTFTFGDEGFTLCIGQEVRK